MLTFFFCILNISTSLGKCFIISLGYLLTGLIQFLVYSLLSSLYSLAILTLCQIFI